MHAPKGGFHPCMILKIVMTGRTNLPLTYSIKTRAGRLACQPALALLAGVLSSVALLVAHGALLKEGYYSLNKEGYQLCIYYCTRKVKKNHSSSHGYNLWEVTLWVFRHVMILTMCCYSSHPSTALPYPSQSSCFDLQRSTMALLPLFSHFPSCTCPWHFVLFLLLHHHDRYRSSPVLLSDCALSLCLLSVPLSWILETSEYGAILCSVLCKAPYFVARLKKKKSWCTPVWLPQWKESSFSVCS